MILIVASLVSALLGEWLEAVAIMAIVLLNAIIGVVQEQRAEAALAALKKLAAPNAFVVRDGARNSIPSRELVPGDIVILEDGNYVPADVRLIESINLRIEEAALTGESMAVEKTARARLEADIPLGDRQEHGLYGHAGDARARPGRGGGHGHAHPDGPDRQDAASASTTSPPRCSSGWTSWASSWARVALVVCALVFLVAAYRQTDLAVLTGQGLVRYFGRILARAGRVLPGGGEPGDRRGAGGPAGGGDHHAGDRACARW